MELLSTRGGLEVTVDVFRGFSSSSEKSLLIQGKLNKVMFESHALHSATFTVRTPLEAVCSRAKGIVSSLSDAQT